MQADGYASGPQSQMERVLTITDTGGYCSVKSPGANPRLNNNRRSQ
jgi:hypothetical protein